MNEQDVTLDNGGTGDVSHILRPDPDSAGPRGYRSAVRGPVSPEVLSLVTAWVTRQRGAS